MRALLKVGSHVTGTFETYGHEGFVSAEKALTCELRMGVADARGEGSVNNAFCLF